MAECILETNYPSETNCPSQTNTLIRLDINPETRRITGQNSSSADSSASTSSRRADRRITRLRQVIRLQIYI